MRKKDRTLVITNIPKGCVADEVKRILADDDANVISKGQGNLPEWARNNADAHWPAVDAREKYSGPAGQKVTLTLPVGLGAEQSIALVNRFIEEEVGSKAHAYAIRTAQDGSSPITAEIISSARVQDRFERDIDRHFNRFRHNLPQWSGCQKDGQGKVRGNLTEPELTRLQNWKRMSATVDGQ